MPTGARESAQPRFPASARASSQSSASRGAALDFTPGEHVALGPLTTFGIGGPARWFAAVRSEPELAAACGWASRGGHPLCILGGGSNVLVADRGFLGLVIKVELPGIRESDAGGKRLFAVAAGEDWDALVSRTVAAGCAGMECLAGIPGSVGGTPVQNVGAYGQEVAQTITRVRCFDRHTARFVDFSAEECRFSYRGSRFNTEPDRGRYIVTEVEFALEPQGSPSLAYADLGRYFASAGHAPSLEEVADAVRTIRRRKGMVVDAGPLPERDPDTRSAGSFFKNPVVSASLHRELEEAFAPLLVPSYGAPDAADGTAQRKLPAAWLLEQAGCGKGFRLGGAAVSSKHSLALTNWSGHASAGEVLALRDTIVEKVQKRFGIRLEQEPVLVG